MIYDINIIPFLTIFHKKIKYMPRELPEDKTRLQSNFLQFA